MSPLQQALEQNAKALLDLTNSVLSENAHLIKENRKLHTELEEAADQITALEARIAELEAASKAA